MSVELERLVSPSVFDLVFPVLAFSLVIVLPTIFVGFFMIQVLRGRYPLENPQDN